MSPEKISPPTTGGRGGGRNFLWGHLKSTVYKSNPHTIQALKDNISHAVAAIKITMLHRVYLNMVTARLLTNCSNTLRNIHTNATENITRTRAKRKGGYFVVAHPVVCHSCVIDRLCVESDVSLVETTRFRISTSHWQNNKKSILGPTKKLKSTNGDSQQKAGFNLLVPGFYFKQSHSL